MSTELEAGELADLWGQLSEQLGEFNEYEYNQTQQVEEFYSLSFQGVFSEGEVEFSVSLDQNNQIVGFFVTPAE